MSRLECTVTTRAPNSSLDIPENFQRAVERINPRARAHRDADRVRAGDACAEHRDLRRRHAGNAAEQNPHAAALLLQAACADLDRHAAGDLRHRREQRQPASRAGDRFVRDADCSATQQILGLLRIGREMQVGEEHLPLAQPGALRALAPSP